MTVFPTQNGPLLSTERLEIWLPQADDIDAMIALVSHPETHRFLGPMGSHADHFSRILRNTGSWMVYGYGICVVKRIGESEPVGNCGIFQSHRGLGDDFDNQPEAGWIMRHDCTGLGYAGEAMQGILDWFDQYFGRAIVCLINPENTPSHRLARKLGFAALRDAEMPDGDRLTLLRRPPPSG